MRTYIDERIVYSAHGGYGEKLFSTAKGQRRQQAFGETRLYRHSCDNMYDNGEEKYYDIMIL